MYKHLVFLLPALLLGSCAPLHQSRTTLREEQLVSDSTLVRLLRREHDRRVGTLCQTVVEFAPPAPADTTASPPAPVPHRIIRTEITLRSDRTTDADSLGLHTAQEEHRTAAEQQLRERPSNGVQRLRWTAVLLLLLAALGLFVRWRRR